MKRLLLIGEHDKGLGTPFHPSTLSGRRLREMEREVGAHFVFENMLAPGLSTSRVSADAQIGHVEHLLTVAKTVDAVVLLGARVQRDMAPVFPDGVMLPHPGARRPEDLRRLRDGLLALVVKP